jgi:hypothetical protein
MKRIVTTNQGMSSMSERTTHSHLRPDSTYGFDARGIAKRFRHAAIFGALDALEPGAIVIDFIPT